MKPETPAKDGFRARGKHWPLIVVAILATSVGGQVVMAVVASSDPSFVIEKDYYEESLRWDDKRAEQRDSAALGWKLVSEAELVGEPGARKLALRLAVVDAAGRPIRGAEVSVRGFAVARSAHISVVGLEEREPGSYGGQLDHGRAGVWQVEVEVVRGSERFVATERLEAL